MASSLNLGLVGKMGIIGAMSFVNDIFLSYAHIDNQTFLEGDKGWIANLHRALDIRLAQLMGRPVKIWRDPKLDGNDIFADKLVNRLPTVRLLVSIFSPRYLTSEWCLRELEEFQKAAVANGGVRIGEKSRVFKVVKTPVPLEDQPDAMQGMLGYEFFTTDPETGRVREHAPDGDEGSRRKFWAKLDDLAHDIATLLKTMDTPPSAVGTPSAAAGRASPELQVVRAEDPGQGPATADAIFLAETTYDLRDARDAVRRELQALGHTVLPDAPLPLYGPDLEAVVQEILPQCRMCVHLVGENYGIVPEGATRSVVELQNDLAAEFGETEDEEGRLLRLLWQPPELTLEDERQQKFLERLKADPRMQSRTDFLETSLEELKASIEDRLRRQEEASQRSTGLVRMETLDGLVRIYLICDERDLEATSSLEDALFDLGYEVILPVFDGDEAQVRQDHEENLISCDAVLLYYGTGNELWLRRKQREILKSAGFGRKKPILGRAIYVAPPLNPQKKRTRSHEALVLHAPGGEFDHSVLELFLAQITERMTRVS